MSKKNLMAAVVFVAGAMLFPQKADYAALLSKAKEYESNKQYVHALGYYWDAMEVEPEKADEAVEAYNNLSTAIKSGKSGDESFDDFDTYERWVCLYNDFLSYWTKNSIWCFNVYELKKDEINADTHTVTYKVLVRTGKSAKYNRIRGILQAGNEKRRMSGWNDVPADFDLAILSEIPLPETYKIQLGIKKADGSLLVKGPSVSPRKDGDLEYIFTDIDRPTIKTLDAGNIEIIPIAVICNKTALDTEYVKWSIKGGMDTDIPALVMAQFACGGVDVKGRSFDFYMQRTEVTQDQFKVVTGKNLSSFTGPDRPAENITWYEALDFCNKLSVMMGLTPCYNRGKNGWEWDKKANGWRLPTEDEWEFAAKGGPKKSHFKYSGSNNLDEVAWYRSNSGSQTHDVATKKANAIGLYDMSGNVWEWCWDKFSKKSPHRVCRGGSWVHDSARCEVSRRDNYKPGESLNHLGFRIVRSNFTK